MTGNAGRSCAVIATAVLWVAFSSEAALALGAPRVAARTGPVGGATTGKTLFRRATVALSGGAKQQLGSQATRTAPVHIDLPTALRLAGANNIDLALVRTAERRAKAVNDAATLQFFPWLSVGASYAHHTGAGQEFSGNVLNVDKQLYGRAATLGVELDLGDALFNKLAAQQLQRAAIDDVTAARKDTLLAAANAYFDLVDAVAVTGIARDALHISQSYETQLERAVAIGLTNRGEALQVSVQTQRDKVLLREAQAAQRRDSAALATVLRLDPATDLVPADRIVVPPNLISLDTPTTTLVRRALRLRREIKASAASVRAAQEQRSAAKYGPLIPSLSATAVYGRLRGGPNGFLGGYQPSHDYVVGLRWRLGPGGLFDFSRTEAADAKLDRARLNAVDVRQRIERQVVDALADARSARDQVRLSRRGAELAAQNLKFAMERKAFGVYAVLEVVQAQQDLTRARRDYAGALTRYAKAQYALARAVGVIHR